MLMSRKPAQWMDLLFCPLPTLWTICHVMHRERHVPKAGDQSQNCWATASRILGRNMVDVYVHRIGCRLRQVKQRHPKALDCVPLQPTRWVQYCWILYWPTMLRPVALASLFRCSDCLPLPRRRKRRECEVPSSKDDCFDARDHY